MELYALREAEQHSDLLGLIFLLIVGSGTLSLDDRISRQPDRNV